jgi:hypothetical protein
MSTDPRIDASKPWANHFPMQSSSRTPFNQRRPSVVLRLLFLFISTLLHPQSTYCADDEQTSKAANPPPPVTSKSIEEDPATIVDGRVIDRDGKPIAGAPVVILKENRVEEQCEHEWFAETTSGEDGSFHFAVPKRTQKKSLNSAFYSRRPIFARLSALAPGYGACVETIALKGKRTDATLRLEAELPAVGGFIFDEHHKPIVGTTVNLISFTHDNKPCEFFYPAIKTAAWPQPVKTDEQGRFVFRNIGRDIVS